MRWITLVLVAANIVLFGWFWQRDQAVERMLSQQAALPNVPPLVLLSERNGVLPERVSGSVVGAEVVVGEAVSAAAEAVVAEIETAEEPEVDVNEAPPAPVVNEAEGVEPDMSLVAIASAPGLESEAGGDEPAPASDPAAPPVECYRLSHFSSRVEAESWLEQMPLLSSRVDEETLPREPDYWVYIPDPGRSTLRRALRKELSDMGFDSYWVQRGQLKGQLSLGLYRNKESAESLTHLLNDRGYAADVYLNPRTVIRYVVEIVGLSTNLASTDWASQLAKMSPPIKTEKKLCQGLASTELPE